VRKFSTIVIVAWHCNPDVRTGVVVVGAEAAVIEEPTKTVALPERIAERGGDGPAATASRKTGPSSKGYHRSYV
jgi:hypothetical protein